MDIQAILIENTSGELRKTLAACNHALFSTAREIRIRQGLPLSVRCARGEFFVSTNGDMLHTGDMAFKPTASHITGMVEKICGHSLYAFDTEIKNGFLTMEGGHRVGLSGRVTPDADGIKTFKNISGLTVRIAREVRGAANAVFKHIYSADGKVADTVFISPPGCGKTTILRDTVRQLSYAGYNVAVVDERSEIGGCNLGVATCDLGPRTDVLDAAPKTAGMVLALRSLAPQVIAVDEIGSAADLEAVELVARSGVAVLCTLHGEDVADIQHLRPNIFKRYVFLTDKPTPGTIAAVRDANFKRLDDESED